MGELLKGVGVSAGIAQGSAYVLSCGYRAAVPQRTIEASDVAAERDRYDAAVATAQAELRLLRDDVRAGLGDGQAEILNVQSLVVLDRSLRERVFRKLEQERVNVEAAVSETLDEYVRALESGSARE